MNGLLIPTYDDMLAAHDRIRPHIRLYVNTDAVEKIDHRIGRGDTLHLICALSGG